MSGKGFGYGGFSFSSGRGEPSHAGFSFPGMVTAGKNYSGSHLGKKRVRNEDDYFEDAADDVDPADLMYLPAPDSPTRKVDDAAGKDSDDSDDPLDAFMQGIEKEVKHQELVDKGVIEGDKSKQQKERGIRDDIESEDIQEAFFRYMEENPMAGVIIEDDEIVEYDADGNAIIPEKKKMIDPLPAIDHRDIDYARFNKNFYVEHEEITAMSADKVNELRDKLGIRVSGIDPPKPVCSFAHFNFGDQLTAAIQKANYTEPTPIQAQGVPAGLGGRDIIGIAKTGSGKTAAFLWPMLVHIIDQKNIQKGDGPIGLICAPTRELSQQIYQEAKKFGKVFNIRVVCAYGGGNMYEQGKACEEGAEIIVCTPGRLIDLVKKKSTNLRRVTFLVFDEADRMFDLGFEPQVRSIANHVRPDRQTLLFSATFRKRIERLARDILNDPVRVVQGDIGEANEDVTQIVQLFQPGPQKWNWLTANLVKFTTVGSVLIFVTRKANCVELQTNLKARDLKVGLLHGDMSQIERNEVINAFKKQEMPILVATDVAARGLDISHIRTVVNFDVARDIDTHTHRVGRTGRAGTKGTAFTLLTPKDKEFAPLLVRNLEGANQRVPEELMNLALKCPWFKNKRDYGEKTRRSNIGGAGLGFKQRAGLGSSGSFGASSKSSASTSANCDEMPSIGPQASRAQTMRTAFTAQYKTNFVAATEDDTKFTGTTGTTRYGVHAPKNQQGKRKRSRWDE